MAKFMMQELLGAQPETTRLGAGTAPSNSLSNTEVGKFAKLGGESRYQLAVVGDKIQGTISSVETATLDNFTIGGIDKEGRRTVVFDGLEATPGTGTVALGDYVVVGTPVSRGTALSEAGPRVCKATNQPGATVTSADNVVGNLNAAIAKVTDAQLNVVFAWRVVSIGSAATGAVATTGVIERVG